MVTRERTSLLAHRFAITALLVFALPLPALAEPEPSPAIAKIIDEGMNCGEVMTTASAPMDGIGPRLTNSDN